MKIVTYSLEPGGNKGDQYYQVIDQFADTVLREARSMLGPIIVKFTQFISAQEIEDLRSAEEYYLELMTLGVLWLRYSDDAAVLNQVSGSIFAGLVELRERQALFKPGVDLVRGILGTFFLAGEHRAEVVSALKFTDDNLARLLNWLSATGEFIQEVRRLKAWQRYLQSLPEQAAEDLLAAAVTFAVWFEQESLLALGRYTENVDFFLENKTKDHRWREDLIFCSRGRVEYHLNMVGAEIMNRVFRDDFRETRHKAVLLPACIRRHPAGECRARKVRDVFRCSRCDTACQVYQIKQVGEEYGFEVLIIPHESAAFTKETIEAGELGVVGIACVLNLMAGGWRAKSLGIPAQCVLLNYCGCKNHWDDEGFTTAIDMDQLRKVLMLPAINSEILANKMIKYLLLATQKLTHQNDRPKTPKRCVFFIHMRGIW